MSRARFQRWAGRLLVGAAGAVFVVSVATTVTQAGTVISQDPGTPGAGARVLDQRRDELAAAEHALVTAHRDLLAQLPGVDVERLDRDRAAGRVLALSLGATTSTSRSLLEAQHVLDVGFDALGPTSPMLGEFLPVWWAATRAGGPVVYRLDDLAVQPVAVYGARRDYLAVARYVAVPAIGVVSIAGDEPDQTRTAGDEPEPATQRVLLRYATDIGDDGEQVVAWEAQLLHDPERDDQPPPSETGGNEPPPGDTQSSHEAEADAEHDADAGPEPDQNTATPLTTIQPERPRL